MSCVRPLDGYRVSSGKVVVVGRGERCPPAAITRVPLTIPCQKCIGCRLEKARQWGIRCLHEKKMWTNSVYVTLTYDDAWLPRRYVSGFDLYGRPKYSGSVCVRDVQLFMKRLRKKKEGEGDIYEFDGEFRRPVRFFLGAEYGDENGRPHYHALLFNCGFADRVFFKNNKRGEPLYTSAELSSLWSVDGQSIGHCTIGEVTFDSAVYCAKYAIKRLNGERSAEYETHDADGVSVFLEREFANMSRRPGIGRPYYEKFGQEIIDNDSVVVNGRVVQPPHYYDTVSERREPALMHYVKRARKREVVKRAPDNTAERLRVKEKLAYLSAQAKERKL